MCRGGVGANPHRDLVDTCWKNLCHIGSLAPVKDKKKRKPMCGKKQYLPSGQHAAVNGHTDPPTHWEYETKLIWNVE